MTDAEQAVKRAEAFPVGEHACMTCPTCACTFASVHPACPPCSERGRFAKENERLRDSITASEDAERKMRERLRAIEAAAREAHKRLLTHSASLNPDSFVSEIAALLGAALAADRSSGSELKWKSGAVEVGIEPTLDTGEAS